MDSQDLEHCKFQVDYLKFLTSLSTGAILIIAAFLGKAVENPVWQWLVGVSLVGFFLALVLCLFLFCILAAHVDSAIDRKKVTVEIISAIANMGAILSFLIAILALVIWCLKNLV
jgi:hypothetical protein